MPLLNDIIELPVSYLAWNIWPEMSQYPLWPFMYNFQSEAKVAELYWSSAITCDTHPKLDYNSGLMFSYKLTLQR